jgi:hypothetical protein
MPLQFGRPATSPWFFNFCVYLNLMGSKTQGRTEIGHLIKSSQPEELDLAAPKVWRRLLPSWLRALIWVDSAPRYDAFLSYSWNSDSEIAPVIQSLSN